MANKKAETNPDGFENLIQQAVAYGMYNARELAQQNPAAFPDAVRRYMGDIGRARININDFSSNLQNLENLTMEQMEMQEAATAGDGENIAMDAIGDLANVGASSKPFNLKKYSQSMGGFDDFDVPGLGGDIEPIADDMEDQFSAEEETQQRKFESGQDIVDYVLSEDDKHGAYQLIINSVNENARNSITSMLDRILSDDVDAKRKEELGLDIFGVLIPAAKVIQENDPNYLEGNIVKKDPTDFNEMTAAIKELAIKTANELKEKKSFNLKKFAQHKSVDQSIIWGPAEKRYDPFYRGPVSDYHVVERNKGFGKDLDGIWNIDWEMIWRGNVMDKFSRPYRDKDGNWVGGYLHKRFEVDKNIPEANNLQLKPGQRRRPIVAELGNTESRLQAMRNKNDKKFDFQNTDAPTDWNKDEWATMAKPYNLKEASSKKKVSLS